MTALLLTSLLILNETGAPIRIAEMQSKCGTVVVAEGSPLHIAPGASATLAVERVIHTYVVCGSGLCSSSALGFELGYDGTYTLRVRLDDGWLIDGKQEPDHWVGNKECGK